MAQVTRLGLYGGPRAPYGSFAGKAVAGVGLVILSDETITAFVTDSATITAFVTDSATITANVTDEKTCPV